MAENIMSEEEWCRRPTWHGCYSDYVKHITGLKRYHAEQQLEREIEEIANRISEKMKGKKK